MSGHSKWSQIKRQKGIKDKARGTLFSKISRIITLAVIEGGGIVNPENNIRLRLAVEKAKSSNMPKENIQRAIEKGVGPNKEDLREIIYEGFGPFGVKFIIVTATSNSNRTLTDIRHVMERNGGKLGVQGSTGYFFKKCGLIIIDKNKAPENEIFAFAEKNEAFDIDQDSQSYLIYIPYENLGHVKQHLGSIEASSSELDYLPVSYVAINDKDAAAKVLTLFEALEQLEDVQKVFANFNIPEEFMQ